MATVPERPALRRAWIAAAVLAVAAAGAFGLVALMHAATREEIAASARRLELARFDAVLDGVRYDNDLLADTLPLPDPASSGAGGVQKAYRARLGGRPVAVVLEAVAPDGYSGPLRLLLAVATDGSVLGVRVTSHRETPGLGDFVDIRKTGWIRQFDGRSLQSPPAARWKLRRDDGDFDQYTGATVTSRAVTAAVADALAWFATHRDELLADPATIEP
jgi:electron transport complex protein RnfG